MTDTEFWSRVLTGSVDECWPWLGARMTNGYGKLTYGGWNVSAHRLSYVLAFGPIPEGMCILHKCDNPRCVNPAHLRAGTQLENMQDMHAKGRARQGGITAINRAKTHCKRGHPFSDDNLRPAGNGRRCKTCAMLKTRAQRARRRVLCQT